VKNSKTHSCHQFENHQPYDSDHPPVEKEEWTNFLRPLVKLADYTNTICMYCRKDRSEHRQEDLRCPIPNCTLSGPPTPMSKILDKARLHNFWVTSIEMAVGVLFVMWFFYAIVRTVLDVIALVRLVSSLLPF
jgi:hypothetical protein